ncbi:MAG: MFS transporter [Candidatus Bathyarchaeota archaeon]|nr:MFS transporter [Candidatus Bathyarchaeota archaeon]
MGVVDRVQDRGRLFVLSATSALRGIRDNLRTVVWQPFAISLGLDMQQVGTLESLSDLVKLLLEPAFGVVSDALGRKRLLVLREAVAFGALLLMLYARNWQYLFVAMLLIGVSNSLVSVWSTLVAESAPVGRLGFVYSVMGATYTGAGLIGTLGAGYLADAYGYGAVYTAATIFAFLSLALVWLKLPETRSEAPAKVEWRIAFTSYVRALNPPKELRGFYVAMGLDLLAFSMGMRLLSGMLNAGYGYTPWMIALYVTAMTLTQAVAQIPLGRLADRFGYGKFMAISQFTACIVLGLMIASKELWVVVAANLLFGVANAFWMPAEQAWIAANVDPKQRAQALGSFSTFRGLLGLPAPIIGGILFDAYGFNVPILMNLIIAFIDGVVILAWVKDKPRR